MWRSTERSESLLCFKKTGMPEQSRCVIACTFHFFRWCGEKPDGSVTETSSTNKMTVVFYSDESRVDQGFLAQYEAIDIQNRKQFSFSNNEYSLTLGQCFSC